MAIFSKTDPGTLPHLRWNSFQQLVTEESCKGLHLTSDKVLGSTPDFCVCHHNMWSILALNINMKNKQIFKWKSNQLFSTKYLITLHHSCVYLPQIYGSASPSASLPVKSLSSQDDEWISELDKSCRPHFIGRFFVNFGLISHRFLVFLLLTLNR